jgi:hypothetical protein
MYHLFFRSEFKANYAEWINTVKPNLGPGIREWVQEAVASADDPAMEDLHTVRTEFRSALAALLEVNKPTHQSCNCSKEFIFLFCYA